MQDLEYSMSQSRSVKCYNVHHKSGVIYPRIIGRPRPLTPRSTRSKNQHRAHAHPHPHHHQLQNILCVSGSGSGSGYTSVSTSLINNNVPIEIISALLSRDETLMLKDYEQNQTLIHMLARNNDSAVCSFLIQYYCQSRTERVYKSVLDM
jgi:hypothetical protein